MIKGILWDNDGVLVDTEHLYFLATQRVLESVGVPLSREEFIRISLIQGQSAFVLAQERGVSPEGTEDLRQQRNALYAQLLLEGVAPMEGVTETLKALQGRVAMAIVTSSHRDHFDLIHSQSGLLPFFDFCLTREDYLHSKPHPEPYLLALKRSGLKPEECLVVEDSERGLRAAIAAGLRCLVIPGQLTRDSDFSGAHAVLARVEEVPTFLD